MISIFITIMAAVFATLSTLVTVDCLNHYRFCHRMYNRMSDNGHRITAQEYFVQRARWRFRFAIMLAVTVITWSLLMG